MRARLCSFVLLCSLAAGCPKGPPKPGEDEFEAASDKIRSGPSGGPTTGKLMLGRGTTESEKQRADRVAQTLKLLDRQLFSGHDEGHSISFTSEFIAYCRHSTTGVAFLINVPQFKRYQDDVRDTLLRAAWAAAVAATDDIKSDGPLQLAVGLRGNMSYGAIAVGLVGEEPTIELGESLYTDPLFPFFASPIAEEAKSEATREAPPEAEAPPAPPVAPVVPKEPPRMQAVALFTKHRDADQVASEILAHAELQGCAATLSEGSARDYFIDIKADGRVQKFSSADLRYEWTDGDSCVQAASKTWRFGKGKPETARVRVGYKSDPLR